MRTSNDEKYFLVKSISGRQNVNVKFKISIVVFAALFLVGCNRNANLKQPAKENTPPAQSAIDLNIQEKKPIKILFVGDMMFDRYIRQSVAKYGNGDYGYILELLRDKLAEYDLVVGNLEGPITEKESTSVDTQMDERKNLVFTFDPAVAKALAESNIKLVSLGNNHVLNQGGEGAQETKKYLDEAGVEYFGDTGFDGSLAPVKDLSGTKIGFVSYNYSVPDSEKKAIEEIKLAKEKSDFVIVCPHWGTEYQVGDPGTSVRALAHQFIDAGADAVIGTHPHVIQSSEEYNGKKIYYSLGNFVFDQYFQKETTEGLGVEITINPDGGMEYNELKFEMTKRGQTILRVEP
jgi:hypothetical protein